eukprot:m.66626 g.66626  ORF g.66626 m.66626 type:complete len:52 (+) comp12128_c0_seq2:2109-2264(+)
MTPFAPKACGLTSKFTTRATALLVLACLRGMMFAIHRDTQQRISDQSCLRG